MRGRWGRMGKVCAVGGQTRAQTATGAQATNDASGETSQGNPASAAMEPTANTGDVSNGAGGDEWEDMALYNPPGAVWGENGIHAPQEGKLAHPLTGMALRPYAIGEKFTHGVIAAGNGFPYDRIMVAQAQGDETGVNLRQLCKEAGLDCGLVKMLNDIPDDQTMTPNGAKLLLPNYSDDSALPPGAKWRKRRDMLQERSEYLAAMEEVRKDPQMMQYMEQDKTGDPFRAIAYVRGTPIPSNDWSVRNWFRLAGKDSDGEDAAGYWLGYARKQGRDVVYSLGDNKRLVDNNLAAAERFGTTRLGVWDFFPGAQPSYLAGHALVKSSKSYPGGSNDTKFVENWGQEGNRLRQLDKERRKAGQ